MTAPTSPETKTATQWIHSCHKRTDSIDVVLVKEKTVTVDAAGTILHTANNLREIRDPRRCFWVTKPQFQNHKFKKETELLERLDKFKCYDRDLCYELKKALGMYPGSRLGFRNVCDSPYVYGADIDIEALIKMKYMRKAVHDQVKHTIGSFDIEKSVLGCNRINLISCTHENLVYVAILDDFLYKRVNGRRVKATLADVHEIVAKLLGKYITKYNFQIEYFIHSDEVELLRWIFSKIHHHQTDFIGIWNMDYDIPQIADRLRHYNIAPENIFCPPELSHELKYFSYKRDKTKTQHITDKWHWLSCASHTQFVDSMNTYARIRKAQGKEPSYKLDFIATKELAEGKLSFGEQADHHVMQSERFLEYIAYNILDTMLLQLMEWKNHDITTMTYLTGYSPLADFAKQTGMLKNTYYMYCLDHGRVNASTGKNMITEFDKFLAKAGGAVLRSDRARDVGLYALIERQDIETLLQVMVSDLDYSSVYPMSKSSFNVSKETKLSTTVAIEGFAQQDIESLFGGLASPTENCVPIGHKFFNLPDYSDMERLFSAHLTNISRLRD